MRAAFTGQVVKGRFIPDRTVAYYTALNALTGKPVTVTIGRTVARRTTPQNKYLWGVVYALIAAHTGHSADEVHDAMRARHLRTNPGDPIAVIRSTTDLTTDEMSEYMEAVKRDAATGLFGESLYIPEPGEVEA